MTLPADSFNCTKYPGICKPTTKTALLVVQEAQRQLNRVAHVKNLSKIGVDGDVGPGTLKLAQKALGTGGITTNVQTLAVNVDGVANLAKAIADQAGAPQKVSGGLVLTTPSVLPPGATSPVPVPEAGTGIFGSLTNTHKLILAGLAGLIVYKKFIAKRGKRR